MGGRGWGGGGVSGAYREAYTLSWGYCILSQYRHDEVVERSLFQMASHHIVTVRSGGYENRGILQACMCIFRVPMVGMAQW